jgi:hypothetical protein
MGVLNLVDAPVYGVKVEPLDPANNNWFPEFVANGLNTLIDAFNNTSKFLGFGEIIAGQVIYDETKNQAVIPMNVSNAPAGTPLSTIFKLILQIVLGLVFLQGLKYTVEPLTKPISEGGLGGIGSLVLVGVGGLVLIEFFRSKRK